jgi:hypothetical protein
MPEMDGKTMRGTIASLVLLLISNFAQAQVNLNSVFSDGLVTANLGFRKATSNFERNGNKIQAELEFRGAEGNFRRQGVNDPDKLQNIRYLTVADAQAQADSLRAPALDASSYFDTTQCQYVIAAEWVVGLAVGKVLWCTPEYSPGANIQGVYWLEDNDWEKPAFTGYWEGNWR